MRNASENANWSGNQRTGRTAFAGSDDLLRRALTHYVNDVKRAVNLVGHNDGPVSGFTFDL